MKKIYKAFCATETAVCGTAFVAIVALTFMSAILRMLKVPLSWNMDLAMLLLAWASFLGADCAFRAGQMTGIDLLTRNFPKKAQNTVSLVILAAILTALLFFAHFGIKLVRSDYNRQYSSLPISFSWATLSLPVAAISMIVSTLLKIKNCIRAYSEQRDRHITK
ncbi:TRAP transporter small permease [Treponema endosymbiont of Eucomonympha sp.]|uniref:TRAP transporter small permease n=1 Tax=Treponema endosymbiont of Eucomonympha sp. TaxID=1580831 RepID=UPI0007854A0E|nr:TRAP transporter small permease [Treponema endosymbiont of Eucomonympha sp.]